MPVDRLAPLPDALRVEEAATFGVAGLTALRALRRGGQLLGARVLVTGASGGVGTFAVQIAKALGTDVTAVTSTTSVDMVRSIGADQVLDYTREDFTDAGHRYDLILDIGGTRPLSAMRGVLTPEGTIVMVAPQPGQWIGPVARVLGAIVTSRFGRQKVRPFLSHVSREDLLVLKDLIEAGKVTPVIDRTYPFDQIPEAVRHVEAGHARGKVVITV